LPSAHSCVAGAPSDARLGHGLAADQVSGPDPSSKKKIIASIFARREAGKRGFMREGFVPRAWMARADMDGSGVLVCLTHEGDCHGKEKSEKEIR
jgi:hypothetical protein